MDKWGAKHVSRRIYGTAGQPCTSPVRFYNNAEVKNPSHIVNIRIFWLVPSYCEGLYDAKIRCNDRLEPQTV